MSDIVAAANHLKKKLEERKKGDNNTRLSLNEEENKGLEELIAELYRNGIQALGRFSFSYR